MAFDKFEKSQISHIFSANQRQFQKFHTILLINFQGILQEIARKCLNQLQHFGTWKENFIIIWLTLKTSFLLLLKKIKKYWMKNKNWHPKILSWYLEVANCQFFCICKTWIRNWGYRSKDQTSTETSQFLRFSLKEQKSLKHFWPLAAIYCKIPWNPVSYLVGNLWFHTWFAEKLWYIWEILCLSRSKFSKLYRLITCSKWLYCIIIFAIKAYFDVQL